MGRIRTVSPGKTRGYPYPVCKKTPAIWCLYFDVPLAIYSLKVSLCYLKPITAMGFGKVLDLFLLKILV